MEGKDVWPLGRKGPSEGKDVMVPRKERTNGPSEGKDVILFSRVPSPAPFFICANFVFLALLSVYFLRV